MLPNVSGSVAVTPKSSDSTARVRTSGPRVHLAVRGVSRTEPQGSGAMAPLTAEPAYPSSVDQRMPRGSPR